MKVNTVRTGDPFVAQNAARLQAVAFAVLGQQVLQQVLACQPGDLLTFQPDSGAAEAREPASQTED